MVRNTPVEGLTATAVEAVGQLTLELPGQFSAKGLTIASKDDATAEKSTIIVDPLLIFRLITKIKCVHMSERTGMEVQTVLLAR